MAKNGFLVLGALLVGLSMTPANGQQIQRITITETEYAIEPKEKEQLI